MNRPVLLVREGFRKSLIIFDFAVPRDRNVWVKENNVGIYH